MGHSKLNAFCAGFTKEKCVIIEEVYDRNLGARDLDWAIAEHFAKGFTN